jgi:hypothetical protein
MATDKRINYINQDGYKNYIKNSDSITIPKKFKARKEATSTHLAYITKAEAVQLKKQNKGTPHKGPKGIPSYDDYDASAGRYGRATSGQQMSAMETGGGQTEQNRVDARALGYTPQEVADIRGGAQKAAAMGQRGRGIRGVIGGLGRGIMSIFGGIPGRVAAGLSTAKNWATRTGQNIGEEVDEFGNYETLDRWLNRNTNKYKGKPYKGQGQGYNFNDTGQTTIDRDYESGMNTFEGPFSKNYLQNLDLSKYPLGNQNVNFGNTIAPSPINYNRIGVGDNYGLNEADAMTLSGGNNINRNDITKMFMGKDGGRIGYRDGEFVDEDVNIQGPGFDVNENVEMAEADPFHMRIQELMSKGLSWEDAYDIAAQEFQDDFAEGPEESFSDQGIASLV